jgi:hypothetical protein
MNMNEVNERNLQNPILVSPALAVGEDAYSGNKILKGLLHLI